MASRSWSTVHLEIEKLGDTWHPTTRTAASSIGVSPLFGRRVFQYAFPFDYSGIQWGWIHIGLSLDAYDESVRRTYQSTGALSFLCGALSLLISLVYAARLVRPIRTLHVAVEKLAQGTFTRAPRSTAAMKSSVWLRRSTKWRGPSSAGIRFWKA